MQLIQSTACCVGALLMCANCIAICLCEEVNDPLIHYNSEPDQWVKVLMSR